MLHKFIFILFRPWFIAIAYKAYEIYTTTDLYESRVQFGNRKYALEMYRHNLVSFWNKAFLKYWVHIIFMPWTFIPHPDIQEYGGMK